MAQKTVAERFADKKAAEGEQIGTFEVRKIVREFVPIMSNPHSHKTFGGMLDDLLADAAKEGGEVQSIGFEIAPEAWGRFADAVRGGFAPVNATEDEKYGSY